MIGKKGAEIEKLKQELTGMTGKEPLHQHPRGATPDLDAQLVTESVALQLERRVAFRRAMKESVARAMRMGAQGIRIQSSGRLGGAEIARREWYREGRVPLHTLRADVNYGTAEAKTTYGLIGVKVWIFRGEASPERKKSRRPRSAVEMSDAATGESQMAQDAKGPPPRTGVEGLEPRLRRLRLTVSRSRLAHGARDRSGARGAHAPHQTRRSGVGPVFPDKPLTKKPAETRMGKGKGAPEVWVAVIKPGRIIFEMEGVTPEVARQALQLAGSKLSLSTQVRTRRVARHAG